MEPIYHSVFISNNDSSSLERHQDQNESQTLTTHYGNTHIMTEHQTIANDSGLKVEANGTTDRPSTHIRRQYFSLLLASGYTFLAIFTWAVTCILSFRPIGVKSYGYSNTTARGYGSLNASAYHKLFNKSVDYFHLVRILKTTVDIITIPVTTTLCSKAAVIYVQQRRRKFSLRQSIALADDGWVEPKIWMKLIFPKNWKLYGSSLLWLGILLHALGFVLAPLQQGLQKQKTIKTPTWPIKIFDLGDITDLTARGRQANNNLVQSIKYSLTATNGYDMQPYIWLRESTNCTYDSNGKFTNKSVNVICEGGDGTTYSDLFSLQNLEQDPFIAQLPAQFNTGLIRQFLPRLNSSLTYDVVNNSGFPEDCDQSADAFYAEYSAQYASLQIVLNGSYSIQVCMPGKLLEPPWRVTRDRQDITELLYLKATINSSKQESKNTTVFKVKAKTTMGYFELPNYLNGGTVGTLIHKNLNHHCDEHCLDQGQDIFDDRTQHKIKRADFTGENLSSTYPNSSIELDANGTGGPLLMVTMALFGKTSYIATRTAHREAYEMSAEISADVSAGLSAGLSAEMSGEMTWDQFESEYGNSFRIAATCYDMYPLAKLSTNRDGTSTFIDNCINLASINETSSQIQGWLQYFWTPSINSYNNKSVYQMQEILTAALYISNEIWLKQFIVDGGTLVLSYDLGADMLVPSISLGSIIVISSLLGLFTMGLLGMAFYASHTPAWTSGLDSFTMMKIGASISKQLPLMIGEADEVIILDEASGWIGDNSPDAKVGRLGLGAQGQLRGGKKYECYKKKSLN